MEPKVTTPVVKGLVLSLILIVFGISIYLSNQMENQWLGWVPYIILAGGVIASCIIYAKQMNANVTFGNVFAHGFKTTAVIIAIQAVYVVLSIKVIFPEITEVAVEASRKALIKQGKLSDDQIEQAADMTRKYMLPFAIGGTIIGFGFVGAIASAIGAAAAKKNPVSPFNEPQG